MRGRSRRKDWCFLGFQIQEEVGHRKWRSQEEVGDLRLASARISSQWEGLHASEALDRHIDRHTDVGQKEQAGNGAQPRGHQTTLGRTVLSSPKVGCPLGFPGNVQEGCH